MSVRVFRAVPYALLAAFSGCIPLRQQAPSPSEGIVGTWRLVEFWDKPTSTTQEPYRYGERPCGYIIYTATGHMSAQIATGPVAPNVPRDSLVNGAPTASEALQMIRRHVSYFGRYTVDSVRSVVTHHVEGDVRRRYAGLLEPRPFRLHGDTLVIGNDSTWRRTLIRQRADERNDACAPLPQ